MKKIVSYIWSRDGTSKAFQRTIIKRYCKAHSIHLDSEYSEIGETVHRYSIKGYKEHARILGTSSNRNDLTLKEFEKLLLAVANDEIQMIIVASLAIIYSSEERKAALLCQCADHKVELVEANDMHTDSIERSVLLYHRIKAVANHNFTVQTLDKFAVYVASRGWEATAVFVDLSYGDDTELCRLSAHIPRNGYVLVDHLAMISRQTGKVISFCNSLYTYHAMLVSLKEGTVGFVDSDILNIEMTAILLTNGSPLTEERIRLFVLKKTKWTIKDSVCSFNDIKQQGGKTVLLVSNFNVVDGNTEPFFRKLKKLHLTIYSLEEGGIRVYGD